MQPSGSQMRILYYNWVDYLDDEHRGGGVSVYQVNLINALAPLDDVFVTYLSSGISHDKFRRSTRWEQVRHGRSLTPARYEIVNSGCLLIGNRSSGS